MGGHTVAQPGDGALIQDLNASNMGPKLYLFEGGSRARKPSLALLFLILPRDQDALSREKGLDPFGEICDFIPNHEEIACTLNSSAQGTTPNGHRLDIVGLKAFR